MSALYPRLDHQSDETPASYASRLARLHGETVRSFCRDLGIAFQALVDGGREAIGRLADVACASVRALSDAAVVRTGPRTYEWLGEELPREALRRGALWVCPRCVQGDLDRAREHRELAPYNRARWQLAHVRTCPEHGLELRPIPCSGHWAEVHDFAAAMAPLVAGANIGGIGVRERPASDLEGYLMGRLGCARGEGWLDGLSWYAAAQTCEMLGATVIGGRHVMVKAFGSGDWLEAGSIGYAIATGGPAGIREFLADLDRSYARTRAGTEGPQAIYGTFWEWLYETSERSDLRPLREVVRRHVAETTPVGPDEMVLGRPVGGRVLHSLHTAAQETGRHPKTMRKILRASGIIGPETDALNDHAVLFGALAARETLLRSTESVTQLGAQSHLNATRVQMALLVSAGHVKPFVRLARSKGPSSNNKQNFAVVELDAFMTRLTAGSVEVDAAPEGTFTIPAAAKRACCGAMEIVELILGGRLAWVGRLRADRGYMSMLVSLRELKAHVQGQPAPGLTLRAVERRLRTSSKVVGALVRNGRLSTFAAINPENRCPISVVAEDEVRRFEESFVSLARLSWERQVHMRTVKREMQDRGIAPTLGREDYGASFYRRSDVV